MPEIKTIEALIKNLSERIEENVLSARSGNAFYQGKVAEAEYCAAVLERLTVYYTVPPLVITSSPPTWTTWITSKTHKNKKDKSK